MRLSSIIIGTIAAAVIGCGGQVAASTNESADYPVVTHLWSEYPSWSVFGVAGNRAVAPDGGITFVGNGKSITIEAGERYVLVNPKTGGSMGVLEDLYEIDYNFSQKDYDPCMQLYGNGNADSVCLTNIDILPSSLSRPSVMILATSTSDSADAFIVEESLVGENLLATLDNIRKAGIEVRGLDKSVSDFTLFRAIEEAGGNWEDYADLWSYADPAVAATGMQQRDDKFQAIVVWNPFKMETLARRGDSVRVVVDSGVIPNEIIDSVFMSQALLDQPHGERAAQGIIHSFYAVCDRMNASTTRDDTLIAIGERFSNLSLGAMRQVVRETVFYDTPAKSFGLMTDPNFPATMDRVTQFSLDRDATDQRATVSFGNERGSNLRIDASFIQAYQQSQP